MAEQDLASRVTAVRAMVEQSITSNTATNGDTIAQDTLGGESYTFIIQLGALNDIAGVISLEERDGAESFAAVAAGEVLVDATASLSFDEDDDNKLIVVGYIGKKDDVRLVITSTSTVGANLISAICVIGGHRHKRTASVS